MDHLLGRHDYESGDSHIKRVFSYHDLMLNELRTNIANPDIRQLAQEYFEKRIARTINVEAPDVVTLRSYGFLIEASTPAQIVYGPLILDSRQNTSLPSDKRVLRVLLPQGLPEMAQDSAINALGGLVNAMSTVHDLTAPYEQREQRLGIFKENAVNRAEAYEAELLLTLLQSPLVNPSDMRKRQRKILKFFPRGLKSLHPEIRYPRS